MLKTEALLPDQPEELHFYYHVTAFNATGESEASPTFGLMLNAPDEEETNTGSLHFPAHEMPIRRELGAAMMAFVQKTMQFIFANDEEDTVMRQVVTEEYRQAVLKAARQNIEVSLAWHTLTATLPRQPAQELLIRFDGGHKSQSAGDAGNQKGN